MDEFQVWNCLSATCFARLVALSTLLRAPSLATLLAAIRTHASGGGGRRRCVLRVSDHRFIRPCVTRPRKCACKRAHICV